MYLMDSLLSPQFPVLLTSPEQSHTNPTAKNSPGLNKNSWFLYLQMSFCSFLRLQFSVETNLLHSIRTGQRPLTPFIYDSLARVILLMILLPRWFLKQSARHHLQKSHPFPKYSLILTISCVVSAWAAKGVWNVSRVRRYLKHNLSHLPSVLTFSWFGTPSLLLWTQSMYNTHGLWAPYLQE